MEIENGFLDVFGKLEDPRREHRKLYPMAEILFVTLCSLICGAESWIDVETFGYAKDSVINYFPISIFSNYEMLIFVGMQKVTRVKKGKLFMTES
jgi:hypothetical protein